MVIKSAACIKHVTYKLFFLTFIARNHKIDNRFKIHYLFFIFIKLRTKLKEAKMDQTNLNF